VLLELQPEIIIELAIMMVKFDHFALLKLFIGNTSRIFF